MRTVGIGLVLSCWVILELAGNAAGVAFRPPAASREGLTAKAELEEGNTLAAQGSSWVVLTLVQEAAAVVPSVTATPGADEWRFSQVPEAAANASCRVVPVATAGTGRPVQPFSVLTCVLRPGVCKQEREPNNTPESADTVTVNAGVKGVAAGGDVDDFVFTASAGESFFLVFVPESGESQTCCRLQVWDPESRLLADSEDLGHVAATIGRRIQAVRPGVYHVGISNSGNAGVPYRLLLVGESSLQLSETAR